MHFVEVLVGSSSFHGYEPLTYASKQLPAIGSLVVVPLLKSRVTGIVSRVVTKPPFTAKEIAEVIPIAPLPMTSLKLLDWMRAYYASPVGLITQQFLPRSIPKKQAEVTKNETLPQSALPKLTDEQQHAVASLNTPGSYILHGLTGTGKTRVYIELAKQQLLHGRSSLILTPEIGLTSQLEHSFRKVFGDRVALLHSGLSDNVRARTWLHILEDQQPLIIIGTRSALFSPVKNLGLIVLDESHETAYKQDKTPYYHASHVAAKLAGLHNATLILGSATPLVSDYYLVQAKKRPIVLMKKLATSSAGNVKRNVEIVDIKDRQHFAQKPHLSNELIEHIEGALSRQEQILLFLNRRGTARVIFCENCGWQATCPHCDLPLIYHADSHLIRCHTCSFSSPSPSSCPDCGNTSVLFKTIGTKAVADEVATLFPDARIQRFDSDNKKSEKIEQYYDALQSGTIDILIGTQTLAKGLDLPNLGLVGIIIADTTLSFPDFSAQERTFQLLTQVLGRVGRGHRESHAIIQTYNPDNPLIQMALEQDWENFYRSELKEREKFMFPPFCYLLKLSCRRATNGSALKSAQSLAEKINDLNLRITIEGPSPAFHEKIQGKYQWQLVIKTKKRDELLKIIKVLPSGWSYDIDPMNLL